MYHPEFLVVHHATVNKTPSSAPSYLPWPFPHQLLSSAQTTDVFPTHPPIYIQYANLYSTDGRVHSIIPPYIGGSIRSMVLAKFDRDGIYRWSTGFPEILSPDRIALRVDSAGNAYTGGQLSGIQKFDAGGQLLWSTGPAQFFPNPIADMEFDRDGNVLALLNYELGIVKISRDGDIIFTVFPMGNPPPSAAFRSVALELDEQDNLYVSTLFTGEFTFNNQVYHDPTDLGPLPDGLFIKLSPNGAPVWFRQIEVLGTIQYPRGSDRQGNELNFLSSVDFTGSVTAGPYAPLQFSNKGYYICRVDTAGGWIGLHKIMQADPYFGCGTTENYDNVEFRHNPDALSICFEFNQPVAYGGNTIQTVYTGNVFSGYACNHLITNGPVSCFDQLVDTKEARPASLIQSGTIDIFPNPAGHETTILFNGLPAETGSISLFNIWGEKVLYLPHAHFQQPLRLNIAHLPPGQYWIQAVFDRGQQVSGKLIIVR